MNRTLPDEENIFCHAVEIPDAWRREEYLRQACHANEPLRRSVEAMLADHEQASRLFQTVAGFTLDSTATPEADDSRDLGTTIGPYRLVHRLGEGGGGVVYEAEQESPVRRRVALKILKPGMDKRRVMKRFQAEREALELMEHPNIARVLDAGMTADDRPYFVMELVRGTRITGHCAKNAVSLDERLHLVQQVCAAVQHAHQKGIIHCDLKPSNILVTLVEGTPVPKVIDFGIAKAAAGAPAQWNLQGGPVGTPAYMSPEQINGSKDIDTRSDIYSLGVILYELLAGRPPFEPEGPSRTCIGDMRHLLQHEKVLPPSQLARPGDAPPLHWNEDLDWIVMTAIDQDRERRYATMRGLGHDIARYLANEPLLARPQRRLYRFRKLVQRNRLASGAIAAGILTLAVGFTTSSLLFLKADAAERKQAQLRADAEEREHVARAAIFLLQNKIADADAEVQRMGGMLTQPSVEATNVFRKLGSWNALRGDYRAYSQRLLALSRVNRFDDTDQTDNATRDLVPIAPVLVEAAEFDSLRQFQEMLLQRLGHTNNPIAAEQVLKICLLVRPSDECLARLKPLVAVAEKSLPGHSAARLNWLQAWRCFALGLWHYRNGNFDQSVRLLDLAMTAPRNELVVNTCCLAVRSMAFRKLGEIDHADADLAEAKNSVENKFSTPLELENQGYWHDWLNALILLREAANP